MFPRKLPKEKKRSSRWRSPAHCNHVRGHACTTCGAAAPIEVAHVRLGSGAGIGQKPDDWRTVSLCRDCHTRQHNIGEESFWRGFDVEAVIEFFIRTSPKRAEIGAIRFVREAA